MHARSMVLLLVLSWSPAAAQVSAAAARNTPPADDSIYALRVNPADYPGQDYVLLVDEATVRVDADGRSSYTGRQVAQVLTPDGVDAWGEHQFWYTPGRQDLRVNWIRVVGPDGKVLREAPAHQQEVSPPVETGAPVYSDRRAIQVTAGGLAPGTLIDVSFTRKIVRPWIPGDLWYTWYVNGLVPVRRSRFTVEYPEAFPIRMVASNLRVPASDTNVAGRRIRTWADEDVPAVALEQYAGTPNDVVMKIVVGGRLSWRDLATWYDSLWVGRTALSPEIRAAHERELRGAMTLDDSLAATYRWVAQDFRYVSLSLGDGGYQPRRPQDVYATRFGDCKDKTILFVALARAMGVDAYPVLVSSDGGVDSLVPSLSQFDHMIAAVRRDDRTEYADLTSSLSPYGELSPDLQQEVGLALQDDRAHLVVLPATSPEHNRYDEEIVGSLHLDGRFVGRVTVSAAGSEEPDLRDQLADIDEQDTKTRDETARQYALQEWGSAVVDSAAFSDGRDLRTPPRVTVWFTAPGVVARAGEQYYFNLPLAQYSSASALSRMEADTERLFPIDVAQVNSPSVYRSALQLELPEGWKANLPPVVSVQGAFGYYRAEFRQNGRILRASREMGGRRGLEPPDSAPALRAWMRAVAEDQTEMIMLDRGTGQDLAPETGSTGVAGALRDVVLRVGDFADGAKVSTEGTALGEDALLSAFQSTNALESYERAFGAEQMVFTAGKSRLVMLEAAAAAFHSSVEARRPLEMLDLMDLRAAMGAYLGQLGAGQASLGGIRSVALDDIGDQASGSVVELVTPVATFDMALLFSVRGRVSTSVLAVGPQGVQDEDLAGLLRAMDERVRGHDEYLTEIQSEATGDRSVSEADSALAANTDIPLNDLIYGLPASRGLTVNTATFARVEGWPTYTRVVVGKGLTFPFEASKAISVSMQVTLHETAAEALKQVVEGEQRDPTQLVRSFFDVGQAGDAFGQAIVGDSTTQVDVQNYSVGTRSLAVSAAMRGAFRLDLNAIVFARGRLSARVVVFAPPGRGDRTAIGAVARAMDQQMRQVRPGVQDTAPPAALIEAVQRVVEAEQVVDSLLVARDMDAVFRAIERAHLSKAPVSFGVATWNGVCWWGSLYGEAKRAMPACDAAVAPDTTLMGYRDSRGIARALVGDLEGARDDFEYVVAHAGNAEFRNERAGWLDALRAGTNPFTPEVLEALKKE